MIERWQWWGDDDDDNCVDRPFAFYMKEKGVWLVTRLCQLTRVAWVYDADNDDWNEVLKIGQEEEGEEEEEEQEEEEEGTKLQLLCLSSTIALLKLQFKIIINIFFF